MAIKKRLLMTFLDTDNKRVSLSLDSPREDLVEEEIKDVMELIVSSDVFSPNGLKLESACEAKVVITDTTEYDLVLGN